MSKGENNIINATETNINMVDDDMNYLVKDTIMGSPTSPLTLRPP